MKAYVDQDACIGCGLCTGIALGVFRINDAGKSEVIADVTEENGDAVREAVDRCPASAIEMDD